MLRALVLRLLIQRLADQLMLWMMLRLVRLVIQLVPMQQRIFGAAATRVVGVTGKQTVHVDAVRALENERRRRGRHEVGLSQRVLRPPEAAGETDSVREGKNDS